MTMMSPQLLRATQLMQLGRHEAAEKELRQVLLSEPNLGHAHSLLAACLLERKAYDEAQAEAQAAIVAEPDNPFAHYMLGRVWYERQYLDRAAASIDEAIRLDPTDADYHAFRAAIYFQRSQWQAALNSAETGLMFEPEHTRCNNFRSMALVKLGRKAEAGATIDAVLAREPENSYSHANKGWTLLESRRADEGIKHFRESLRLDPTNDWARAGLVEALKARNPIYGLFLRYMLWMAKLPPKWQWGVVLGGYFGMNFLSRAVEGNELLELLFIPISIAYLLFALFTWLARPFFNLLLRLHPLGRHALRDEDRLETTLFGGLLLGAAGLWALSFVYPDNIFGLLAIGTLLLTLPLHVTFVCSAGWPRKVMIGVTAAMALIVMTVLFAVTIGPQQQWLAIVVAAIMPWYRYGLLFTMIGGQMLAQVRPKR